MASIEEERKNVWFVPHQSTEPQQEYRSSIAKMHHVDKISGKPWQFIELDHYSKCSSVYPLKDGVPKANGHGHCTPGPSSEETMESKAAFCFETIIPFLLAGFGMVAAGILLENAIKWEFLSAVPEALILIPALLGLKGNLEMTLASRLSTMANLGQMDSRHDQFTVFYSNLALIQTQAIVVALVASMLAILTHNFDGNSFDPTRSLSVILAATMAASAASFILASMMVLLTIFARRTNVNPDNITTPLAAATGDVTSLAFLVFFGTIFYKTSWHINICCFIILISSIGFWVVIAYKIKSTRKVLQYGWFSVFLAMFISSGGGYVLKHSVDDFPIITLFQPVINGVGGNLVAVQASKISTKLHRNGTLGSLPAGKKLISYFSPANTFFSQERESTNALILMLISIPGHAVFLSILYLVKLSMANVCSIFLASYLVAGVVQVAVLLYICQFLCRLLWVLRFDPDNNAIPLLTSLGDLIGTSFLLFTFVLNQQISSCLITVETMQSNYVDINTTSTTIDTSTSLTTMDISVASL